MMMIQIKFHENISLLDKVGGSIVLSGLSEVPASSYVKKDLHKTIYGHEKKVCLEYYIAIGSHYVQ